MIKSRLDWAGSLRERNFRIVPLAFLYNLQCGGVAQVARATVS